MWTCELAAEVSFEQELIEARVSGETIRATLQRMGVKWARAKHWITSPDPEYSCEKASRPADRDGAGSSDRVLGFEDETWWSRPEQPNLSSWAETDHPLRLMENALTKDDPGPKALACYGLLVRWIGSQSIRDETIWLRFVEGNPNRLLTEHFLAWFCEKLQALGNSVLVLVRDHASWHISHTVQQWIRENNCKVKKDGQGVPS